MTDIELAQPRTFVAPDGQVLDLDAPTGQLGRYLADIRELESRLREAKALLNREVLARMDRSAKWTHYVDGLKLSAPSPDPAEEWDAAGLREELLALADNEIISIEAVDAAVEVVVEYQVRKAGVNALRKLPPPVPEVVGRHCREVERRRYVSVGSQ